MARADWLKCLCACRSVGVFPLIIEISDEIDLSWHAPCVGRRMQPDSAASTNPPPLALDLAPCDTTLRYVRVLEERVDGLVVFEFAIGWPELAVELLLPAQAFAEFCATQCVQRLDH